MATNYNYPDPANIEAAAQYRPGVASNIFNVLTGGLAGQITGSTQKAQEAARARQALLQEEFGKRDEERSLRRQLMVNAVQQNIQLDPNASIQEMMDKIRSEGVKGEVIRSQGRIFGLGQGVGPSPYETDPRYQAAVLGGQREIAEKRAEATALEDISRTKIAEKILGFGGTPTPDASAGQLEGQLENLRMAAQSRIPAEERGNQAKAGLMFLQQKGEIPMVVDVAKMSPEEAIAQYNILGEEYRQKNRDFAFERKAEAENKAVDDFNLLLSNPNRDQEALKKAYLKLPKDYKIEEYRIAAGVARPATAKENESLDKYISAVDRSSKLAKSVGELAGLGEISKVSKSDFNAFTSWIRGLENKFGAEDARLKSINNVVQEFQALIAQQRKDFFGASLTDNEFEVAKQLFADPKQSNFLPRVIELVDSIMSKDEIQRKYERRGIFVDPATKKDVQDARNQWIETKKQYNFGGLGAPSGGLSPEKMSRLQELQRKKNQ